MRGEKSRTLSCNKVLHKYGQIAHNSSFNSVCTQSSLYTLIGIKVCTQFCYIRLGMHKKVYYKKTSTDAIYSGTTITFITQLSHYFNHSIIYSFRRSRVVTNRQIVKPTHNTGGDMDKLIYLITDKRFMREHVKVYERACESS